MKKKILDTFAGAGGFSLGFHMTGLYEIIGAIEIDKWAAETYKFNNPNVNVIVKDICLMTDDEIVNCFGSNKPDIILGGPPCQGFSIANRNAGDDKDPRNSLFEEFIRIGKLLNPEVMIMENVPNLIKAKTSNKELVINIIQKELEDLGYFVKWDILTATDYGVPQIRKRLIVIASKKKLGNWFPKPTHKVICTEELAMEDNLLPCPTLWDAISDLPDIEAREGDFEMDYTKNAQNEFQQTLRLGSTKVYNHTSMQHSKRMIERFESMSWGDSSSDVPEHLRPLKRNGNGEKSETTYDQNNRRMYPFKPCHTIAASFYANFVHPYKNRNFTPREGARIQTFPDTYVFKGKPTVVSQKLLQREERVDEKHLGQYNQIGNAVPPFLAKAIADNLHNELNK
ncbi:DNA cytosine methyltransferase [Parabacteroides provencensis]|uniref:DNA cytosine methyltransferase n=1 Tax=Parabacteroides provencensis TaxID=1944636 RepID=UPI000C1476EF|nr:DNA cytosine methyltransferase [Parabacteroides provencensis]